MKIFRAILALLPLVCQAQEATETRKQFSIDLGLTGLLAGAELKTGKRQSLQFRTGLLPQVYKEINIWEGTEKLRLDVSLGLSAEYRFYYNLKHRAEKNRNTQLNGGNYAGWVALILSRPLRGSDLRVLYPRFLTGPLWGFNRALSHKILFHASLGPVYNTELNGGTSSGTGLYLDARLSFVLN